MLYTNAYFAKKRSVEEANALRRAKAKAYAAKLREDHQQLFSPPRRSAPVPAPVPALALDLDLDRVNVFIKTPALIRARAWTWERYQSMTPPGSPIARGRGGAPPAEVRAHSLSLRVRYAAARCWWRRHSLDQSTLLPILC